MNKNGFKFWVVLSSLLILSGILGYGLAIEYGRSKIGVQGCMFKKGDIVKTTGHARDMLTHTNHFDDGVVLDTIYQQGNNCLAIINIDGKQERFSEYWLESHIFIS